MSQSETKKKVFPITGPGASPYNYHDPISRLVCPTFGYDKNGNKIENTNGYKASLYDHNGTPIFNYKIGGSEEFIDTYW